MNHDQISYDEGFAGRLSFLRAKTGRSARDMSLSIGQNPGCINSIESGKALPSMAMFFEICRYLNISPADFFQYECYHADAYGELLKKLEKLNERQFESIETIVDGIVG